MKLKWTQATRNSQSALDLKAIQDSQCAICGSFGPLELDHDHRTGLVRGWLCRSCNVWLGHHLDKYSKDFLQAALVYLKEPPVKFLETHPYLTERYLKCSKCQIEKAYTEFHRYRRGGSIRFSGYCKPCHSTYMAQRKSKESN